MIDKCQIAGCVLCVVAFFQGYSGRQLFAQEDGVPKPLIQPEAAARFRERVLFGPHGIPEDKDVREIMAEIVIGVPYGNPVERFSVPKAEFKKILSMLRNADVETDPILAMPEMGSLLIYETRDRYTRVCWYCGAKAPLMFSINGVRCRSRAWNAKRPDDGSLFGEYLRELAARSKPSPPEPKASPQREKQATARVSDTQGRVDDGFPYGPVDDQDVDQLQAYAKEHGVDLMADLKQAYSKQGERVRQSEDEALGRVFRFATQFQTLDKNARTYGHVIYSTLLNLGETWGIESYARVVKRQSPGVQQRVRDFMLYGVSRLSPEERDRELKATKDAYPLLFPASYEFGHNNSLFATASAKQHCSCATRRGLFGSRYRKRVVATAAEEPTTTCAGKTKEASRELEIVGKCFDIGAFKLGVNPTAHTDLHQFLVETKRKVKERGSDKRSSDVFRKVDLANNKVSVSGKEFHWRVKGTEHDSLEDGTALVWHYEIYSPTSKISLAKTVTVAIPR